MSLPAPTKYTNGSSFRFVGTKNPADDLSKVTIYTHSLASPRRRQHDGFGATNNALGDSSAPADNALREPPGAAALVSEPGAEVELRNGGRRGWRSQVAQSCARLLLYERQGNRHGRHAVRHDHLCRSHRHG